jgi:cytochrome c biogenesis protein CcmG/thiol:disulfide interchange protein DsbE
VSSETQRPGRRRLLPFLPLLVFLGLAGLFLSQLTSGRDISEVPSVLIGHIAPNTELPPLEGSGLAGLRSQDFIGNVTLVNVFASWCAPCREEHPLLVELAKDDRFVLAGMNYKDKGENALKFLSELGNPYKAIGADENGRTGIDWGVYGVPETFVVSRDGKIAYKHVGPLTPDSVRTKLMPEVEKALAAQTSS